MVRPVDLRENRGFHSPSCLSVTRSCVSDRSVPVIRRTSGTNTRVRTSGIVHPYTRYPTFSRVGQKGSRDLQGPRSGRVSSRLEIVHVLRFFLQSDRSGWRDLVFVGASVGKLNYSSKRWFVTDTQSDHWFTGKRSTLLVSFSVYSNNGLTFGYQNTKFGSRLGQEVSDVSEAQIRSVGLRICDSSHVRVLRVRVRGLVYTSGEDVCVYVRPDSRGYGPRTVGVRGTEGGRLSLSLSVP